MNDADQKVWLGRLRHGLGKSSAKLKEGIGGIFTKQRLDGALIEELEDFLISADLGVSKAARLAQSLAETRFHWEITPQEVRQTLADGIAQILAPVARPFIVDKTHGPHVVLFCGVNGGGKTTTIGKLAKQFRGAGHNVMLAAADTFRAAAIEQLQVWGERTGCPVIFGKPGADAAGLAYNALSAAQTENIDLLFIDTAGRLHNKTDLMAEVGKIVQVVKKLDDSAPHDRLLVMDATVGQNALAQVEVFQDVVDITGLVMTKLDGTAKGGVVVALAEKFALPVVAVGVGEGIDDMRAFEAQAFARSLMSLEN